MPLTRKGSEILQAMQAKYGGKKGTSVFYASANNGTITGVHLTHHVPVTNSPFHGLRPPRPEGAMEAPHAYIPEGTREVTRTAGGHDAGIFRRVPGAATVGTDQRHTRVGHPSLRPPVPEGANASGLIDYIPAGRRGVLRGTRAPLEKDLPAHMDAARRSQHQRLAHEVASGLRKFTFAQVARQQPAQL